MLLAGWIMKRTVKKGNVLNKLQWQIPLSLVWFAAVFSLLLILD